jgi:uncharacterized protein involved in exopolysaccharide biosynthesis
MKIFRVAKFKPKKRKAKKDKLLRKSDWDVLVKHDRLTGKVDLRNDAFAKDPDSVSRLLEAEMIFPDGYLTPEARKKCAELAAKIQDPESLSPASADLSQAGETIDTSESRIAELESKEDQITKPTASDWAVLMKYDRKTGNLLQYDPETGQLDETSRAILKDPEIIQRLIDNNMILPGGWLTPEAKAECNRIAEKLKARTAEGYKEAEDDSNLKGKAMRGDKSLSVEVQTGKMEHMPKPAHQLKGRALEDNMPNIQAFFEQLPTTYPQTDQMSESAPESRSQLNQEPSREDKDWPSEGLKGTQKQLSFESSITMTRSNAVENSVASDGTRHIDLKAHSKFKSKNQKKRKGKKKGSDISGGGIDEPPRFSPRDVFHIIFKRKIQILTTFLLILSAAIIGTLMMEPVYEASTQILVKLGRESVFVPTSGNVSPILNINREQQVNSEIEILKSRALAEKVISTIGPTVLYKDLAEPKTGLMSLILRGREEELTPEERKAADFESAVFAFMQALSVTGVKKSNVIEVGFRNENPRMAAVVVNHLANLYREHHLAVHKAPQNVQFFQDQTQLLKNKLDKSEEKLKALRKQHNITSLEEQRTLLLGQSSALSTGLNATISLEVETEKRIRQLRKQLASVPRTISQGEEGDPNPYLMNTLEARLVELQLKEKELLTKYKDESRLVLNVKEEIRVVKQKLEEQENKRSGRKTSVVNPTYQRLKEELFSNEAELEALRAKKITQREHLKEIQAKLEGLNQVELELKQLEQEIEVNSENYRLYLSKVEESRISDAMDTEKIASVSLIGPARPPRKPVSPKVMLNLLIGVFLGLFVSLSLALFREYLDDRIEKIEDVEKDLQLPVLASIPTFEQKSAYKTI